MTPSDDDRPARATVVAARARLAARLKRLEEGRRTAFVAAGVRRFLAIDGLDLSGLLGIELFTTIIPLMLIGFSWLTRFRSAVSVGDILIRQFGLRGDLADLMRNAFGSSAQLRSVWSVAGLAGFLVWGIPMSLQVAKTYALAWRRPRFPTIEALWRGAVWFVLYLGVLAIAEAVALDHTGRRIRALGVALMLVPSFAFWACTPLLLVCDGARGWRFLWRNGLSGVVIDTMLMRILGRIVMPRLLQGWRSFGPIGMAMGLMTWSIMLATAWVATAVVGALLWERSAPVELVAALQVADDAVVRAR